MVTWFKSSEAMKRVLISLLLPRQNIETNPGPQATFEPKCNLSVRTYNCNGLGDTNKFRRILVNVKKEIGHGGIVLLQETHIKNENIIKTY